jgi:hypothetical protein
MHAVVMQVDFVPGREAQQEPELDVLAGMLTSTPGFVRGTWAGDGRRGLSYLLFASETAARAVADNVTIPPDACVALRSVDVFEVAREVTGALGPQS